MNKFLFTSVFLSTQMLMLTTFAYSSKVSQQSSNLSIQQLKDICRSSESNTQMQLFTSSFTCSQERTFWTPKDTKKIKLANSSEVSVKAHIKDGKFFSNWNSVSFDIPDQYAQCQEMEQWKTTARFAVTIKSCVELAAITTQEEYCQLQLGTVWAECDAERHLATKVAPFMPPQNGQCEYEPTGQVRLCKNGESVVEESLSDSDHEQESFSSESSSNSSSSNSAVKENTSPVVNSNSSSASSSQSDDNIAPENSISSSASSSQSEHQVSAAGAVTPLNSYNWGAELKDTSVRKNLFRRNHKVVLIASDVQVNSLLSQLGFKNGDIVSKINGHRIRSANAFKRVIRLAHGKGQIKFTFRPIGQNKFMVKKINF